MTRERMRSDNVLKDHDGRNGMPSKQEPSALFRAGTWRGGIILSNLRRGGKKRQAHRAGS